MAQPQQQQPQPHAGVSDDALLQQVREYIDYDPDPASRSRLSALLSSSDVAALRPLFLPRIAFGTAGLRARMAEGYHNINALVVLQTTQGLLRYLQAEQPALLSSKGVVVGFDGRHHSRDWAALTAAVFLSQRVPVHLYSAHCPTPLVPFCIAQLGLAAGVMITASHNPAPDNGYKLYWSNSAQIIAPRDAHISAHIDGEHRPWQSYALDQSDPLLHDPHDSMMQRYAALIGREYCWGRELNRTTQLRVTYTAMHGVGAPWAAKAFESVNGSTPQWPLRSSDSAAAAAGADADGCAGVVMCTGRSVCPRTSPCLNRSNPTPTSPPSASRTRRRAPGHSRCPSALQTLTVSVRTAGPRLLAVPLPTLPLIAGPSPLCSSTDSPLIIANDPDADRLAVAEKPAGGEWVCLNGNQIAFLFADYVWQHYRSSAGPLRLLVRLHAQQHRVVVHAGAHGRARGLLPRGHTDRLQVVSSQLSGVLRAASLTSPLDLLR